MVPAHYIVDLALVGCPDPDPTYTRFFTPARGTLPADLDSIGRRYIGALADEIAKWLRAVDARSAKPEPIGVAFSGGIDSGSVFLVTYHVMLRLGLAPARLKAFVLNVGNGPDLDQARAFLSAVGLSLFLEEIEARPEDLDVAETLRVLEDYKALDVECAAMGLRLCRGIRERYPDWTHIIDGDGGDENLKDYPIEDNAELTIRSVVDNLMLYQEGWGVSRIKHSLTYSGGLSRSYVRTYAPGAPLRLRRLQPVHAAERHRSGGSHSVLDADTVRRADAVLAEGGHREARRQGHHRASTCPCSPSGAFSTARCRRRDARAHRAGTKRRSGERSTDFTPRTAWPESSSGSRAPDELGLIGLDAFLIGEDPLLVAENLLLVREDLLLIGGGGIVRHRLAP